MKDTKEAQLISDLLDIVLDLTYVSTNWSDKTVLTAYREDVDVTSIVLPVMNRAEEWARQRLKEQEL